jgi:hypothetical protein
MPTMGLNIHSNSTFPPLQPMKINSTELAIFDYDEDGEMCLIDNNMPVRETIGCTLPVQ